MKYQEIPVTWRKARWRRSLRKTRARTPSETAQDDGAVTFPVSPTFCQKSCNNTNDNDHSHVLLVYGEDFCQADVWRRCGGICGHAANNALRAARRSRSKQRIIVFGCPRCLAPCCQPSSAMSAQDRMMAIPFATRCILVRAHGIFFPSLLSTVSHQAPASLLPTLSAPM
jgi:hypothetical protein